MGGNKQIDNLLVTGLECLDTILFQTNYVKNNENNEKTMKKLWKKQWKHEQLWKNNENNEKIMKNYEENTVIIWGVTSRLLICLLQVLSV